MPAAEGPPSGVPGADAAEGRPAEAGAAEVVVWRVGDALLAAPLDATLEIAAVDAEGRAVTREGPLELRTPPGLAPPDSPRRAVVVRAGTEAAALAADEVEGVHRHEHGRVAVPAWLQGVPARHLAGLVRLEDDRIAALLALDRLAGP